MTPPSSAVPLRYRRLIWVVSSLAGVLAVVLLIRTGSRDWFSLGLTVITVMALVLGPGGTGTRTDGLVDDRIAALTAIFLAAAPASAATAAAPYHTPTIPTARWSVPGGKVAAGTTVRIVYEMRGSYGNGTVAELQRQMGSAHVWTRVQNIPQKERASASTHVPAMGAYAYRIIIRNGHKTLAVSKTMRLYSYGTVSAEAFTDGTSSTTTVGTSLYRWVIRRYSTGNIADFTRDYVTCRSVTLSAGRPASDAWDGPEYTNVHVDVIQENADPATLSIPFNRVVSKTFALTGKAFTMHLTTGSIYTLSVYFNAKFSCYTANGR